MNTYDEGDLIRVKGTFTDRDTSAAVDPTAVFCEFKTPSGTLESYQYGVDACVTKSATGVYRCTRSADEHGTWEYRWYSTGTGQAAGKGSFGVTVKLG